MSFRPQENSTDEPSKSQGKGSASISPIDVTSLKQSIGPLRDWFNANKDKPRFIALLSPT